MKFLTLIFIVLVSCSKAQVVTNQKADVYSLISEQYKLDTTDKKVFVIWRDTVFREEEKRKIDTIKPKWQPICNKDLQKVGLEYRYYLKNGMKLN